ncbi:MAG: hypothetical protein WCI51_17545 [Lentisphaerota bacterium]
MNITFVGGGSLRILPIVRALFQNPEVFEGGSIRLVDLKLERAEAVGTLIKRCPEYRNVNCEVVWTTDLDRALDGADLFYRPPPLNGNLPIRWRCRPRANTAICIPTSFRSTVPS